jgi:hypothetical protein
MFKSPTSGPEINTGECEKYGIGKTVKEKQYHKPQR